MKQEINTWCASTDGNLSEYLQGLMNDGNKLISVVPIEFATSDMQEQKYIYCLSAIIITEQ